MITKRVASFMPMLIPIALALTALVISALPVSAHARLLRADPPPGGTVRVPPTVVRTWYNDELDPKHSTLGVWDARGKRVDSGRGGVDLNDLDHKSMLTRVPPLQPGVYTVRWTAVSLDDQALTKGAFRFVVARP